MNCCIRVNARPYVVTVTVRKAVVVAVKRTCA